MLFTGDAKLNQFQSIQNFTSSYDLHGRLEDYKTGESQLYFNQDPLSFKVSAGGIFRQYRVGDYYLVITLYSAYDSESFGILILNHQLQLISEHSSPDFYDEEICPYDQQFTLESPHQLRFYLGAKNAWTVEALEKPLWQPGDTLTRIASLWRTQFEIRQFFKKSPFLIKKEKAAMKPESLY